MDYGYNYGYDYGMGVGSILGAMLIVSLVVIGIGLVFAILMFIGQWKCFKKAGYNGWESLIGGHNQFVNCTIAGVNPILVLIFMFGSVVTIIPVIGWLAYLGFAIYYQVVVGINTAKAFGKGTGFGIALAIPLSAPIAWFILGKDNVKYVGVKSENKAEPNIQTNNDQQEVNNQQPVYSEPQNTVVEPIVVAPVVEQSQSVENNKCVNCGSLVNANDRFCMHCGKQL